ncbi:MAG: hypothetical protein LBK60_09695 [Verrucomicrobiales bacterium]|jgi:hypothetical protein|nr:hypothetical protein [Verrucomicrobiales bacterium]
MNIDFSKYTWAAVEVINANLCENAKAAAGKNSEGYAAAQQLWESSPRQLPLTEALQLANRCHRLAPFLNFNGNTFVAIFRLVISEQVSLPSTQKAALNSFAGHYIAGTITPAEERALSLLLAAGGAPLAVGDQVQSLQGNVRGVIKEILPDGSVWIKTPVMGTVKTLLDALVRQAG